ncbi:MAG: outer membrane beta-barrel family protein [Salinivirgaceae bacterium]|nr:outer membrane beta-barrel family protein [Salinivirgaceae bacterium]
MFRLKFPLLFASLLIALGALAQPQKGEARNPEMKFYIRGSIIESTGNHAVEYASIVLYRQKDSSMVGGTITDVEGKYEIELSRPGQYTMIVQFIGFEKYTLNGIMVNPQNPTVNLKPITINPSAIMLQETVISDRRNEIIYKIDRKVIQVAGNPNAVGNSAVEVLEATPGIEVDDEGNVLLRGSENFTVLINGKPSVLSGNDALQQIPASSIESIELITNPSARYDPDGLTGIVNVILKEEQKAGINGLIDVSVGNRDQYNGSLILNYRKSTHSITVGYDFNQRTHGGLSTAERNTYINNDTIQRTENGDRYRRRSGHNFRLGYDVNLTKKTSFGINGLYRTANNKSYFENEQTIIRSSTQNIENQITKSDGYGSNNNYDVNATLLHKFDNDGHELQVMATMNGNNFSSQNRNYHETLPYWDIKEWFDTSKTVENYQTIQIDYSKPLGLIKFETGLKSRFRDVDFSTIDTLNPFQTPGSGNNHFLYNDAIHAAYIMGSSKIEEWEFQLGLRAEYFKIETHQISNELKNTKEDIALFPTLHISRSVGNNKFMAGYSRRVNRPHIRFINPYEEFNDAYNVSSGNPDLDPEYSHSVEGNYLRYFGKSTAGATIFYRQTDNSISRVRRLYNTTENTGIMLNTFDNLNKQASLGIEANFRHSVTNWLQVDGNYSFFQYRLRGETNGENIDTESLNHNFRLNTIWRLGKNITLTGNGMYYSPSATAQGTRGSFFMTGFSYRHKVLDQRGTITLTVRNPIGKFKWDFKSKGTNFDDHFTRQPYTPTIMLGFNYRLNDGIKKGRNGGERTEDFSSEMEE